MAVFVRTGGGRRMLQMERLITERFGKPEHNRIQFPRRRRGRRGYRRQ